MARWSAVLVVVVSALAAASALAQSESAPAPNESVEQAIRTRLGEYLDVFNSGDADQLAGFWSTDAVSVDDSTGERVEGREAIAADFRSFFEQSPGARLTGSVDRLRLVSPDVAIAEGQVILSTPDAQPTPSAFTAVMVREGGEWVIESSQERDLPAPESSYEALQQLDWLVGEWRDQTEGVEVNTTVRWSRGEAFLIRSFRAAYQAGDVFEGTQVIGWDPRSKQFRTWTFNSDGSFGEGHVSQNGEAWLLRMSQVGADRALTAGTQIITRVDDDTLQVEQVGRSVDGVPVPAVDPVTVVRVTSGPTGTETQEASE